LTAQNSGKTAAKRRPPTGRRFAKGKSGNPGGRPIVPRDVKEAARVHTLEAIDTLVKALRTKALKALPSRVRAAELLLDRGWGRPDVSARIKVEDASNLSLREVRAGIAALWDDLKAAGVVLEGDETRASGDEPSSVH
jgi:hypothetical protein